MPEIVDTPEARQLLIGHQVQGAAFFDPPAAVVSAGIDGPGPVPACRYMAGWLLAGLHNPSGSGLMIGLGSGAGAVALLDQFPGIDLTVVEIDPAVIDLCLESFPLVEYYMNLGRLAIICGDASKVLPSCETWDFACCDAYNGANHIVDSVVVPTIEKSRRFWCNCIDTEAGWSMRRIQAELQQRNRRLHARFCASDMPMSLAAHIPMNWILTDQPLDLDAIQNYKPFEDLSGVGAAWFDRAFLEVVRSCQIPGA